MSELTDITALLLSRIRDVEDYPEPGVVFKDITPLLADPAAFTALTDALAELTVRHGATKIVGLEARGFILGAPAALRAFPAWSWAVLAVVVTVLGFWLLTRSGSRSQ